MHLRAPLVDRAVPGPHPVLTANVPAQGARATIFDLSLSGAKISTPHGRVDVANVGVTLDAGAAASICR